LMGRISSIFIANRGEIALRLVKACKDLGIESVLGTSEVDKAGLAAQMADRVICIGPSRASDSYLRIQTVVHAAKAAGCNAIHPGYGFLAERPELAETCMENDIAFIGPKPESIRRMGNKLLARRVALECEVPVIPGSGKLKNLREAEDAADSIEYPIMIKAAAGGGGRGIKVVRRSEELRDAFHTATSEASEAFGDGTIYFEHFIPSARHIEVQVAGDQSGSVIHLGERDCSLQRRYQKVIEEAPAYVLSEERRKAILKAALSIATSIGYESLGTVEFIFDEEDDRFFFMEMNTRIQVEHPVTEMICGLDLIKEQIRIATGQTLSLSQDQLVTEGHAIECRITAESPEHDFRPCPGRISNWSIPKWPGVRVDSHCFSGYSVPPFYDSLIGKLITWGSDRKHAIERMGEALSCFYISGIDTNIGFLGEIIRHSDYRQGKVNTGWLERFLATMNGKNLAEAK